MWQLYFMPFCVVSFTFYVQLLLQFAVFKQKTSIANCISNFTNMATSSGGNRPLRVAFCHPDLGLGGKLLDFDWSDRKWVHSAKALNSPFIYTGTGAERLVVDAATELAQRGHQVNRKNPPLFSHRRFSPLFSSLFLILALKKTDPFLLLNVSL